MNGTTISYNAGDEVTSESGANPAAYTYDLNGDVTSMTIAGATTTYSYNAADQLATVTRGATTINYGYDGDGNRATRVVTGPTPSTVNLSWDPSSKLPLLALERDGSNALLARIIYGVGPVAMQTPGGTFFLHTDGQGDVTALSDGTGAVLETYLYDAFGNVTATQTGPTAAPTEPLLFQGQLLDPTTGLYDMRARNYDPSTGRFTQRDPVAPLIGQPVFSPYVFADDMPTTGTDPSGNLTGSDIETSAFNGHSTEDANIVGDTRYGVIALKAGIKGVTKIADYFDTSVAEAGPGVEDAAAAIRDLGPGYAEAGAAVERDLGEAADAETGLAEGAGKLLGAAGIGLGLYFTVEDCEHGTVSQCVGDTVGLAIGAACLVATEGIGSIACGLAAAGIAYVISTYGPQIVQGLSDLGGYIVAGYPVAIDAIKQGFSAAGAALTGAYNTVADQVSKGFSIAANAIVSGFGTAIGALSTGFNTLSSAISSGFNSAISTLEQAGYTAVQLANVLKNTFVEGYNDAVNELINLGYDIDGVARALGDTFAKTAEQAAQVLHEAFDYTYNQIASGLQTAFNATAAVAAQILQGINAGIDAITGALSTVYNELADGVAGILKGLNYTIDQIGGELQSFFNEADAALAGIFKGLNYTVDQIASEVKTLYNETAAAVAQVLDQISATASEIASALQSVFHSTINEVADILQNTIGVAINDVAMALENAYSATAQAVTSALAAIGDTAKEIEGVLSNVFNETVSEIEDALSSFFSSDTISAIGNAFSSFGDDLSSIGDTIASWF